MNQFRGLVLISIIVALPIFSQSKDQREKSEIEPKDVESKRILEIEKNLEKQKEELEELKKLYGIKSKENTEKLGKEGEEENFISPLKLKGLTPEYNRSIFLDPEHAKQFNINQKAWLNDWIRLGAYIRPRHEERYNLGFDKQNKNYISRTLQTSQIFFLIDPSPYFTMKVTFQDVRVYGGSTIAPVGDNRAPTFVGVGNTTTPVGGENIPTQTTIREAWFMLKKLPFDATLQIGRQLPTYGDQRLLGGANWAINALSFDGIRLMINREKWSSHLFGYQLIGNQSGPNGVLSANAPVIYRDPNTGRSATINPGVPNQYLVGTYNSFTFKNWFITDLYSLGILTQKTQAYRGVTLTNPQITIPATSDSDLYNNQWSKQKNDLWTSGFRISNRTVKNNLEANGPWSGWDWTIEAAWQTGNTGVRVNKNPTLNSALNLALGETMGVATPNYNFLTQNQKYTGKFYVIQSGYTFFEKLRIGAQFSYASGDNNRTDGSSSTFLTLPNPRFGVIPYWNNVAGLSENINSKNLISRTINLAYKTDKYGIFHFSYFINDKAQTQDAWYAISGAPNTGASTEFNGQGQTTIALAKSGRRIYTELDLAWIYNWNEYISVWIGAGFLTAGDSIQNQKNAVYSYNLKTNELVLNPSVLLGQGGFAQNAKMFFVQVNGAF